MGKSLIALVGSLLVLSAVTLWRSDVVKKYEQAQVAVQKPKQEDGSNYPASAGHGDYVDDGRIVNDYKDYRRQLKEERRTLGIAKTKNELEITALRERSDSTSRARRAMLEALIPRQRKRILGLDSSIRELDRRMSIIATNSSSDRDDGDNRIPTGLDAEWYKYQLLHDSGEIGLLEFERIAKDERNQDETIGQITKIK